MLKTPKKPYIRLNHDNLNVLSDLVVDNIEDIFDYFSVKRKKTKRFYYGPCPIHDGNGHTNPFNLYYDGELYRGNWKCRSHGCERTFKKTSIGCVRGLLSRAECKWAQPGDTTVSFRDTVDWLFNFLKTDGKNLKTSQPALEKRKFINNISWVINKQKENVIYIPRSAYKQAATLSFSSAYLASRGYGQDIQDKYDIADCRAIGKEMAGRVVIPIFDDNGKYVIGVTGRKLDNNENIPKWRHNKGFLGEDNLFNFWWAKEHINKSHSVVLCESPLNVLRLEQAGINNSVGTFGAHLTDNQLNKLFQTELYTVNLLYDNDDAGKLAMTDITKKVGRIFNINAINLPEGVNDVGDLTVEEVTKNIKQQIRIHI
jgi:hypothetical protein